MAQANWTRKLDWSLTSILFGLSGVVGIAVGMGMAVWHDLAPLSPKTDLAITTAIPAVNQPLQPFFPDLAAAEATLEQARIREIVRREATRQQQLDQTREALALNGATSEDIEAHFMRQLSANITQRKPTSYSH